MKYVIGAFVCLLTINIYCSDMNSFSTFSFDEDTLKYGAESSINNFISLGNDPKSSLPDSFTVCSSILVKFMNTAAHFVQMYTEDGSHWFNLHITILRSLNMQTRLFYMDHSKGAFQQEPFIDIPVPMIPHSWYHICFGLDTVSGHLRIVSNGVKIVDMEKQYFKNSTAFKPKSLIGKVKGNIFCISIKCLQCFVFLLPSGYQFARNKDRNSL